MLNKMRLDKIITIQEESNNKGELQNIMEKTMCSVRPNFFYRIYICVAHIYIILPAIYYFTDIEIVFLIIFVYQLILSIASNIYLKKYIADNKKNIQNNKNIKFITASYDNKIVGFFSIEEMDGNKLWIV